MGIWKEKATSVLLAQSWLLGVYDGKDSLKGSDVNPKLTFVISQVYPPLYCKPCNDILKRSAQFNRSMNAYHNLLHLYALNPLQNPYELLSKRVF